MIKRKLARGQAPRNDAFSRLLALLSDDDDFEEDTLFQVLTIFKKVLQLNEWMAFCEPSLSGSRNHHEAAWDIVDYRGQVEVCSDAGLTLDSVPRVENMWYSS